MDMLYIGIPCMDTIKTETVMSLFSTQHSIDVPTKLHIQKGCYVHDARNKIVDAAIASGASHLLFVDSDVQFDSTAIPKLLKHDKDIVGGLYYRRQPPHYPTINQVEGEKLIVPGSFPKDKLFEVFAIATGFMLIKISAIKKIEPPWFYYGNFHGKAMGEDVYFCWKAQKKGIKVWCDPTIHIGHVGEYVFDGKDYDAYQDVHQKKDHEDVRDGAMN